MMNALPGIQLRMVVAWGRGDRKRFPIRNNILTGMGIETSRSQPIHACYRDSKWMKTREGLSNGNEFKDLVLIDFYIKCV